MNTPTLSVPKVVPDAAELGRVERRARWCWGTAIVGLLSLQVLIGVGSIWLSIGDPSVAIVPNYHQKALDWDATQRARHLIDKLGWQVTTSVGAIVAPAQRRLVHISIRDANGNSVHGLNVTGSLYHHARGADIHKLHFVESEKGGYLAPTNLVASGMWQVQLQIEGEHGLASDTRDIIVP